MCFHRSWKEVVISVSTVSIGLRFPSHTFCFWVKWIVWVSVDALAVNLRTTWHPVSETIAESLNQDCLFPPSSRTWHFVLFPQNTITGVSLPSWFPVHHIPVHSIYDAREGQGKRCSTEWYTAVCLQPRLVCCSELTKGRVRWVSCVCGVSGGN